MWIIGRHDSVEVAAFYEPTISACVDAIRGMVDSVNEKINVSKTDQ